METNTCAHQPPPADAVWRSAFKTLWQWTRSAAKIRKPRRLRVCETLSLGERRFLAVIEFDRQEFLLGGTGSSLELLARVKEGQFIPGNSLPVESRPVE